MIPLASMALTLAASIPVSDWSTFRGDPGLSGVSDSSLSLPLELAWRLEVGGAIVSSPVAVGGVVYFGADDQKLHAVELASGKELWAYETEDMIEAPPLVVGGVVYVGSSDYYFYAIDATSGELRWRFETNDRILGSANRVPAPDGSGDWIVVGSYDTNLYCFDAETGELQWKYSTDNYVNGTPAIHDGRIVFGGCDAILHVVSAETGLALERLELGDQCHVAGSVALVDGRAYFGHYGNAFVCVDLAANEVAWSYPGREAFFSSPAIGEDRVVFGGRDKKLHCVSREDGSSLWTFKARRKIDSSPVITDDRVVFGAGDGRLYVLSLEDGKELWSYEIGRPILSSPAVVDGYVLVGANDKHLYAFGPPGSKVETPGGEGGR